MVLRRFDPGEPLSGEILAVLLLGALASALAADRIGIHALNGGFLFGAAVPQIAGLGKAVLDRMADFVILFLIPIFLAVAGIQTDFRVLTADPIPGILLFLAAMIVAKWFVGTAAGLGVGLRWREANTIGVLMNCRGLMILVVALVAASFGGMTEPMRVVFALGAIVTTLMTGPLVDVFLPREETEAEREKSVAGSLAGLPAMTGGPRGVVVPGEPGLVHAALVAAARRFPAGDGPAPQFLLVHLPGLRHGGDYVGSGAGDERLEVESALGWLEAAADRLAVRDASARAVSFTSPEPEADLVKLATDWAATDAIVARQEDARALEAAGIRVERLDTARERSEVAAGAARLV